MRRREEYSQEYPKAYAVPGERSATIRLAFLPEVFSFQFLWVPFHHLSHGGAAFTSVVTARKETHAVLTQSACPTPPFGFPM